MSYYNDDPQEGVDSEHPVRDMLKVVGWMFIGFTMFALIMTVVGGGC